MKLNLRLHHFEAWAANVTIGRFSNLETAELHDCMVIVGKADLLIEQRRATEKMRGAA